MDWLFQSLEEWLKQGLIDAIIGIYTDLFTSVNEKVGGIAMDVGRSPLDWNPSVFNMIKNLSVTVVNPIAGIILTYVLSYELIRMLQLCAYEKHRNGIQAKRPYRKLG